MFFKHFKAILHGLKEGVFADLQASKANMWVT